MLIIRGENFQLTMSRDADEGIAVRDALRDDGTSGISGVLYYHFNDDFNDDFSRSPRKFQGRRCGPYI